MANYSKLLSLINGVPRTIDFSNSSAILELGGSLQFDGSASGHLVISASATTSTYSLVWPAAQAASSGYVLTNDGTGQLSWASPSAGSVTSVALSLPSIFTVSGSPVTSSGTLTGSLNTQTANTFFAGPSTGSAAIPTFRTIVAADVPAIALASSGNGGVSGILPIANGGTGQSGAAAAFAALSPLTTAGDILFENATPAPARLAIGTSGQVLTVSGGLPVWASPATSGTVTSVALADGSTSPIYTISGSPVTSSGTLEFTLNTQSANAVFAGPTSGSAAQPGFRSLVAADVPNLSATYVTQSEVGANSGVASLDSSGKVPLSQLPSTVMEFQGSWNPTTNSPTLVDGTGTNGSVYWVTAVAAGPISGLNNASMVNFQIGDLVIYNGTQWELTTPAAGVSYVNGAQGAVTVNAINQLTGDVTAGPASQSQSKAATIAAIQGTTVSGTTGSGNVVFSASPTLTGTLSGASASFSSTIGASNFSGSSSGTNTGDQTITLTGDVTGSGTGSFAATISAASVTAAKLATVTDGVTLDQSGSGGTLEIKTGGVSTAQLASAAVTIAKLGTITDGVTLDQSGSGSSLEVKAGGITETQINNSALSTTGALAGGSGTKLSVKVDGSSVVINGSDNLAVNLATAGAISNSSGLTVNVDGSTIDINGSNDIEVKALGIGTAQLAAAAVTAAKLGSITDGVTLDQSASGSKLEIKSAGVSAAQLATGAFDQATIVGGAGTPASVAHAPLVQMSVVAGQSFAANTTFAVRWGMPSQGETANKVYAADMSTSSFDKFWVIGVFNSASAITSGNTILITVKGQLTLGSSDTNFISGDQGAPVWLASSGAYAGNTAGASPGAGNASFKLGMAQSATVLLVDCQMMGVN